MPVIVIGMCLVLFGVCAMVQWADAIDGYKHEPNLNWAVLCTVAFLSLATWLGIGFKAPYSILSQKSAHVQSIPQPDGSKIEVIADDGDVVNLTKKLGYTIPDNATIDITTESQYADGIDFFHDAKHYAIHQDKK